MSKKNWHIKRFSYYPVSYYPGSTVTSKTFLPNRLIMESEAEAESEILRGEAEAFSIEAKAKAEAEKMAKKADAWKEYKEAAMLDMMLESMPKVRAITEMQGCGSSFSNFEELLSSFSYFEELFSSKVPSQKELSSSNEELFPNPAEMAKIVCPRLRAHAT